MGELTVWHLPGGCGDGVREQVVGDRADQVRRRREQVAVPLRRCAAGGLCSIGLLMVGAAGSDTATSVNNLLVCKLAQAELQQRHGKPMRRCHQKHL